ncbi:MAG: 30S ribosomal protein S17 [Proteobacteria bacterium]|nr:30S ribosomal protein S17 [Pseudomonadota bacterium]
MSETTTESEGAAGAPAAAGQAGRAERRVVQGVVRSSAMDKTIVVEVRDRVMHAGYKKYIARRRRFMAHDEANRCQVGDVVRIVSSRPLSRRKSWRLLELVERPS